MSDATPVHAVTERAVASFGQLDMVFTEAGIDGVWARTDKLEPDGWNRTLAINLRGS